MPGNSHQSLLRERVRQEVPTKPGVYTWLGANGEALYVGKSSNLRRRMLSYLSPRQVDPTSRTRHLAFSLRDFSYRETQGELLALLLEDALIKQLQPRHNERGRDFRERCYLLLRERPNPELQIVETESISDGVHFGPFKDEHFVADLTTLLTETLTPPNAARSVGVPGTLDIAAVRQFLEGDVAPAVERLSRAVRQASERLQFERAAVLRDRMEFCRRFGERERFLRHFTSGTVAIPETSAGLEYQFGQGALTSVSNAAGPVAIPPELREAPADVRWAHDRANVVFDWTRKQRWTAHEGDTVSSGPFTT